MVFFIWLGALFDQALALQVRWFAFALGDRQARVSCAERKNVRLRIPSFSTIPCGWYFLFAAERYSVRHLLCKCAGSHLRLEIDKLACQAQSAKIFA